MTLKPVANGISNLTVSGSVLGSNLSGTNTGDNPGVTSVTSSGSYGGLTLTGSTGPTAATVVLGGLLLVLGQLVSLEIHLIQLI
jgi:hypothetical protein